MHMIRQYDTTKGIITTDKKNNSLRNPGKILIVWTQHGGTYSGGYTRNPIQLDNLIEEIPEGAKIKFDLQRLMDKCPLLKGMATITEEEYQKVMLKYEKPGCLGKILQSVGLGKNLDDELRKYFKS